MNSTYLCTSYCVAIFLLFNVLTGRSHIYVEIADDFSMFEIGKNVSFFIENNDYPIALYNYVSLVLTLNVHVLAMVCILYPALLQYSKMTGSGKYTLCMIFFLNMISRFYKTRTEKNRKNIFCPSRYLQEMDYLKSTIFSDRILYHLFRS